LKTSGRSFLTPSLLGSRNFLCLGVTSELIFVAAMVLKGFQRKTALPVLLLGVFFCGRGDERLAVFEAGGRARSCYKYRGLSLCRCALLWLGPANGSPGCWISVFCSALTGEWCIGLSCIRRNRQLDPKWRREDPAPGPGQEGRNRGQDPGAGPGPRGAEFLKFS
jgi:hypothetical protein